MRICIHRGAQEIGGTCVEIESQGRRIVLDIGLPLDVDDADAMPLHPVPGFERPDPSLLGVVISAASGVPGSLPSKWCGSRLRCPRAAYFVFR